MRISEKDWGALPDGRKVRLFTLDGGAGLKVDIMNYGGVITSIKTPDSQGRPGEVGLGFDSLAGYLAKTNYYGALIGRVANRIAGGKFSLGGQTHQLYTDPKNGNHLHGGKHGFNQKLWRAKTEGGRLRLDYLSVDGEEYYPGNLEVSVWYEVRDHDLVINYEAVCDQPTPVNLTNHEFFNLNGSASDILRHEVRIRADAYTPVNANLLPTGEILPVKGTPMDFTEAKAIGRDLPQIPEGYDHNYVLTKEGEGLAWCAEVYDPDSGRILKMATSEPCVQFYIGNFLDGSDTGREGRVYHKRYGFCLEAQKHPDALHHPNFANVILNPGEKYTQTTIYRFVIRGKNA